MKKSKKVIITATVVIVLAVLGVGGYFLYPSIENAFSSSDASDVYDDYQDDEDEFSNDEGEGSSSSRSNNEEEKTDEAAEECEVAVDTVSEVDYRNEPLHDLDYLVAKKRKAHNVLKKNQRVKSSVKFHAPTHHEAEAVDTAYCEEDYAPAEEEKIFDVVEQMPSFPGGQSALFKYLSNNIIYPSDAYENDIQGKVYVKFCVEKDGSIGDVILLKSLISSCDSEAVRVVRSMPKWYPGKQNGMSVRVWYTLPIVFKK